MACLNEGGGPQIGEVTCGGLPHLTCKRDQIEMRELYGQAGFTPPKRVTSPTWGPPPPFKQALNWSRHCKRILKVLLRVGPSG